MRTRDADKEELVRKQAVEMLVKDGFEGFSMNKLSAACGISVATLYIYYRDKEDLIKKIGTEVGKDFMSYTLRNFSPQMDFAEGLRKQWENRAAYALKFPDRVACYEIIRHTQHGEHIQDEIFLEFRNSMMEFCQRAVKNKQLVSVPLEVFWSVAYGPLYSLLRFHKEGKSIGGKPFKFSRKTMEDSLQLILKALTP